MKRNGGRNTFPLFIVFILIAIFVSIGYNKETNETDMPFPTPTPNCVSVDVSFNNLQKFYLSLHSNLSFDDIINSLDSFDFVYNDFSNNSCCCVFIGYDTEVIKQYHAADGESIEIYYPKIRREKGQASHPYLEGFIYNLDAKRYYTLIQLFPIEGYTSSYWNHKETGTYVREWPTREGIDEYIKFDSVEEAMKYIIINAYQ